MLFRLIDMPKVPLRLLMNNDTVGCRIERLDRLILGVTILRYNFARFTRKITQDEREGILDLFFFGMLRRLRFWENCSSGLFAQIYGVSTIQNDSNYIFQDLRNGENDDE